MKTFFKDALDLKMAPRVLRGFVVAIATLVLMTVLTKSASATEIQRVISAKGIEAWLVEDVQQWPIRIQEVKVDDVRRVAQIYLDEKRSATGWLLPLSALQSGDGD